MMEIIERVKNSDGGVAAALSRYVFIPIIVILTSISAFYLKGVSDKAENAIAKTEYAEAQKAMWGAIGTVTRAQSELVSSTAVLTAQLQAHKDFDGIENRNIHDMILDIQRRVSIIPPEPSVRK